MVQTRYILPKFYPRLDLGGNLSNIKTHLGQRLPRRFNVTDCSRYCRISRPSKLTRSTMWFQYLVRTLLSSDIRPGSYVREVCCFWAGFPSTTVLKVHTFPLPRNMAAQDRSSSCQPSSREHRILRDHFQSFPGICIRCRVWALRATDIVCMNESRLSCLEFVSDHSLEKMILRPIKQRDKCSLSNLPNSKNRKARLTCTSTSRKGHEAVLLNLKESGLSFACVGTSRCDSLRSRRDARQQC
jgi:hypothetical protein